MFVISEWRRKDGKEKGRVGNGEEENNAEKECGTYYFENLFTFSSKSLQFNQNLYKNTHINTHKHIQPIFRYMGFEKSHISNCTLKLRKKGMYRLEDDIKRDMVSRI